MTNIPFKVSSEGNVRMVILDLTGREVKILIKQSLQPGEYKTEFHTGSFKSGVYFCKMETGNEVLSAKIMIVK